MEICEAHPQLYTEDENKPFIGSRPRSADDGLSREPDPTQVDHELDARCLKKISDRFDLTVECIRRHYARQSSPLGDTLASYRDFFAFLITSRLGGLLEPFGSAVPTES